MIFEKGQVIHLQRYKDQKIVKREIISVEGDRIFYRKENGEVGQCSRKLLEQCVKDYGVGGENA